MTSPKLDAGLDYWFVFWKDKFSIHITGTQMSKRGLDFEEQNQPFNLCETQIFSDM